MGVIVLPFQYNTGMWQTGKQTNTQTDILIVHSMHLEPTLLPFSCNKYQHRAVSVTASLIRTHKHVGLFWSISLLIIDRIDIVSAVTSDYFWYGLVFTRDSIYAIARIYAITRTSVRLSVTRVYHRKTVEVRIMKCSPYSSLILQFLWDNFIHKF